MRAAAWPLLLLLAFGQAGFALHNGIPLVPAMGWSSWNTFRCDISSALVLDVADAMVSSGLREAGYLYVSIDDCWMLHERDASGHLVVDAAKFPEGMKWLGDEIHAVRALLSL
jgi:alpha-galactosidase